MVFKTYRLYVILSTDKTYRLYVILSTERPINRTGAGHLIHNAQYTVNAVDEWLFKALLVGSARIAPVRH
jgi:hypothetical protein